MSTQQKIKITCDSTCDLNGELYRRYSVDVIPLGVLLGDELRKDGVNLKVTELYDYVARTGVLPKTSAISEFEYLERWRPYTEQGYSVIHINISSAISACHQNARIAAGELENVYPVDSLNLSSGSGMLVLKAGELAEQGLSAEEIVKKLEEYREKLDVSFVLRTLEYLQKGGRCSGVLAFGANLLKLRPEIVLMPDGSMDVGKKYRGSPEKTVIDYVRGRLRGRDDIDRSLIFVVNSGVEKEITDEVKRIVKEEYGFENIIETLAGCTISSHCGAGTLGIMFYKK